MKTMRFFSVVMIAAGFFFFASCETECPEPIDPACNDSTWNPSDTTNVPTDSTWNGGTDSIAWGDSTNFGW